MTGFMHRPVTVAIIMALMLAAYGPSAMARGAGWYLGLEGAGNAVDDAQNRSRTPDDFEPGTGESCFLALPGIVCLLPEPSDPGTATPGQTQISTSRYADGLALGVTIGRAFHSGARPELGISYRENDLDSVTLNEGFGDQDGSTLRDIDGRVRSLGLMAHLWYDLRLTDSLAPYVGAGLGLRQIELGGGGGNAADSADESDTVLGYQVGAGIGLQLGELWNLSLDYRFLGGDNPRFKTAEREPFSSEYQAQSVGLALRYLFEPAAPRDADGDGVPDRLDRCPGTPAGVTVDGRGCPLDSDGDGVPDPLDRCPGTPTGVPVDAQGCPLDSDGDGVPDRLDQCPGTPAGVAVDAVGCPLDSDGDGVPDFRDQCPGTPRGVAVGPDGCPLDSDGDGVPDPRDACPDTRRGTPVMSDGCGVGQSQVLHGVTFELDRARLNPNARELLKLTAQVLKDSPAFTVEIQGHTCDLGADEYNLDLSQRRADAVRAYLVELGVAPDRLRARGYGEAAPRVPNQDEEQRELNRRTELKVLSR